MLIYSNVILNASFLFDDDDYIIFNPLIRDISYYDILGDLRYITNLTFAFNYAINGYNPFGYHLFNVIVHIMNSLLGFFLASLIFKVIDSGEDNSKNAVAFLTGIIFLVHPVQTQAVSYVTQRYTCLATLFYLVSVVMYIKWRLKIEQQTSRAADHQEKRKSYCTVALLLYCASLISAILAMKTKEIAFTIPFTTAAFEFLLFRDSTSMKKRFFYLIPYAITLILIPLSLFGPDLGIIEGRGVSEVTRKSKVFELSGISPYEYLITQFRVIVNYIRLLFLPINQKVIYDFKISHSILELNVMLSFCLLLSIALIAFYLWKKASVKYRVISIGIIWFFLTLSVESSLIPINDLMFEHRVYLPSIGFFIAISSLVIHFVKRWIDINFTITFSVLLLVIGMPLTIAAYVRNNIWTDEVVFWTDIIEKSPNKYSFYNYRSLAYQKKNEYESALRDVHMTLKYYSEVINGKVPQEDTDFSLKNVAKTYVTRGRIYAQIGNTEKANSDFEHSLRIMSGRLDIRDVIKREDLQSIP